MQNLARTSEVTDLIFARIAKLSALMDTLLGNK